MDKRNVVDTFTERRHRVAEPLTASAVLPPTKWRIHHLVRCRLEELDSFARIEFLAIMLRKCRLVVPQVALARGTRHVELDNALRFRTILQCISKLDSR